jgi:hypothetical protein
VRKQFTLFFLAVIVFGMDLIRFKDCASNAPSIAWSKTYTGSGLNKAESPLQTRDIGCFHKKKSIAN